MKASEAWMAAIGITYIAVFFSIVGLIAYLLYGSPKPLFGTGAHATTTEAAPAPQLRAAPGSVVFQCAGGRSVAALFLGSAVVLTLSDGREIRLPQVISDPGARYANPDGSFVFSREGSAAFVAENGTETYSNCAAL